MNTNCVHLLYKQCAKPRDCANIAQHTQDKGCCSRSSSVVDATLYFHIYQMPSI